MMIGAMISLDDYRDLQIKDSDFSELLLFDGDLTRLLEGRIIEGVAEANPPVRYLHVQEFFSENGVSQLVDLSSDDESIRLRSVQIVAATRSVAHDILGSQVVIHPGGIRTSVENGRRLLANLQLSLHQLGPDSLLIENMPWCYWLKKRQRLVSNHCVAIEDFSRLEGLVEGFVLDICHGYLSSKDGDQAYCERFMSTYGNRVKHIHASDARAPDQEGLQIDEGDIDFSFLHDVDVPILAEVWNGHTNSGDGFRVAIERLRSLEKSR